MIYILEDDASIRELLLYSLEKTGNEAMGFSRPSELYAALDEDIPDVLLLDIMLPEEDGISILAKLRKKAETKKLPIIMLSARADEFDKVTALDLGADDYVTKPFGVMELLARIKALMRRTGTKDPSPCYVFAGIALDPSRRELKVDGTPVNLTFKEFELLKLLFDNIGSVLTRDRILAEIWQYEFDGENRTVDVHVRSLRQKLGDKAAIIETVRGVGYRIADGKDGV